MQPAQQAVQFGVLSGALLVQRGGFCLQTLLQLGIALGAEQLAEDAAALLRRSVEQLCELPLRDEHDLGKLVVVQPNDLLHGGGHVLCLGHRRAGVRVGQGGIRLFGGHALAPGLGALVLRVAAHHVAHAVHLKFQLHKGGGLVIRVLAAQHGALPDAAAGMIVQRVGDGVKNSGLARAGVAGNEIQSAFAQLFKVERSLGGIGAKGRKGQSQRSHRVSPSFQISSISAWQNAVCSAVRGWLFCSW